MNEDEEKSFIKEQINNAKWRKKFRITVTQTVDRIYELDAENKKQALEIYNQFDDRTHFIKEKECDGIDTPIEIEEI